MRVPAWTVWLAATLLAAPGCRFPGSDQPDVEPAKPTRAELIAEAALLKEQNATLDGDLKVLRLRVKDLTEREKRLSDRLRTA